MTWYNRLRTTNRSGLGVLVLVVVDDDRDQWLAFDADGTHLKWTAYYLCLHGAPSVPNEAKVRLKVPKANLLTIKAMKTLMASSAARWAS